MLTPYSLMAARSRSLRPLNSALTLEMKSRRASSTRRATLRCSWARVSNRDGSTVNASVKSAAISSMACSVVRLTPLCAYLALYRSTSAAVEPSRSAMTFTA